MDVKKPMVFAVKHADENVRAKSRSGGFFTALSDYVLENNGIIYGCVMNDDLEAIHIRTTDKNGRDLMRGSKYVQSNIGDIYKDVKNELINGKIVLFTGTSCQIAGLKCYVKYEYENLLCMDIVCHGVPSPIVFREYITWMEKKYKSKVIKVNFRNKKNFGWREHIETIEFNNGNTVNSKVFRDLFYKHNILRPSCYECPYKSIMHPGDITIADYWGIEKVVPQFDDNKGVSLVLVNNDKGVKFFEKVKKDLVWEETDIEHCMQPPLEAPFKRPLDRGAFWKDFHTKKFEYIARKYTQNYGFSNKIKKKIFFVKCKVSNVVKKLIKRGFYDKGNT